MFVMSHLRFVAHVARCYAGYGPPLRGIGVMQRAPSDQQGGNTCSLACVPARHHLGGSAFKLDSKWAGHAS